VPILGTRPRSIRRAREHKTLMVAGEWSAQYAALGDQSQRSGVRAGTDSPGRARTYTFCLDAPTSGHAGLITCPAWLKM
jgi:hypothetical protein